jgi:predicted SnoaL-like aldol condensation-catalyzing enzyme
MSQIELNKIEKNKQIVFEALDKLFNQRDYIAAEHYWSPKYIHHPSLKPRQRYDRVRREERV